MLLLVMVKHTPIFIYSSQIFYIVSSKNLFKYNLLEELILIIEVIILRQENEGQFWLIRSCYFWTPVTGINIDSISELSERAFIIAFKDTIKNNSRLKFQADQTEGLEGNNIKITGRKQEQTMNTIFEGIYIRGANTSINWMNIKLHRGSRKGFHNCIQGYN